MSTLVSPVLLSVADAAEYFKLPWRITDANKKKGREIVDANGKTIAHLTALDIENANFIVSSVNATQAPKEQDVNADFYNGVIAALGVLNSHGYSAGSTLHDEIVNSVGRDDLYAVAEPKDFEWAGLDAAMKEQK